MTSTSRAHFGFRVRSIVEDFPNAVLYGSFSRGTFHFDRVLGASFSDVDVLLPETDLLKRSNAAEHLQRDILRSTGQRLTVSVRSVRIHDGRIASRVAPIIGLFELISKIQRVESDEGREYLMSKFLLRALAPERFFGERTGGACRGNVSLEDGEYLHLMKMKCGLARSQAPDWVSLLRRIHHRKVRSAAERLWVEGQLNTPVKELLLSFEPILQTVGPIFTDLRQKTLNCGERTA